MEKSHEIFYVFVLRLILGQHGTRRRVVDIIAKPRVRPELTGVPASEIAAPKFNLELGPFYLSGNEVYTESNECNLVNNGKGDWKIKFDNSGEDLKGSLANPPCPF